MWLYNFGLTCYVWIIRLVAPRHPKARLWINGRKDLYKRMAETIDPAARIVWIHVASLGEFEQGRPIIERIRKEHPEYKILLTFFSPSGYEIRKNYQSVDYIFYLPIDTLRNARRFLDAAHPEIAVFVKYEFWLNLLYELRRRKVRGVLLRLVPGHGKMQRHNGFAFQRNRLPRDGERQHLAVFRLRRGHHRAALQRSHGLERDELRVSGANAHTEINACFHCFIPFHSACISAAEAVRPS